MQVTFWGVRGSIPSPPSALSFQSKLRQILLRISEHPELQSSLSDPDLLIQQLPLHYRTMLGGNTACVSIQAGDHTLIFDAGTGIRELGESMLQAEAFQKGNGVCHLFFSHLHWDHLQGLPFFAPLYSPGNAIHFYGAHPGYEEKIRFQQSEPYFPVPMSSLKSSLQFHSVDEQGEILIGEAKIRAHRMSHPGMCYSYRIDAFEHSVIYATDSDFLFYKPDRYPPRQNFFSLADLLIFDSQFTLTDAFKKYDYGHCHAKKGVDFAVREGISKLVLFHHDPTYDDCQIEQVCSDAEAYLRSNYPQAKLEIVMGIEGLSIVL